MLNLTMCELIGTCATYWMPMLSAFHGTWIFGETGEQSSC